VIHAKHGEIIDTRDQHASDAKLDPNTMSGSKSISFLSQILLEMKFCDHRCCFYNQIQSQRSNIEHCIQLEDRIDQSLVIINKNYFDQNRKLSEKVIDFIKV